MYIMHEATFKKLFLCKAQKYVYGKIWVVLHQENVAAFINLTARDLKKIELLSFHFSSLNWHKASYSPFQVLQSNIEYLPAILYFNMAKMKETFGD